MATATKSLSLAELEKLIVDRQAQVAILLKRREELQAAIEGLDAEIQDSIATGGPGRRTPRKRAKNEAPLRTVVQDVLAKHKKGLSLPDLAVQVKNAGYKSHSRKFANVVYQCLYNTANIVHDDKTGLYRLKR